MRSRTGKAKIEYDSGEVYEGLILDWKPHGLGTMTRPDGSVDEGAWTDGKMNGQGKRKFASGDEYNGMFQNGKRHGRGTYKYLNGNVYEGDWLNGKRHGEGTYTWPNGDMYKGVWANDKRHGTGIYKKANGDRFKQIYNDGELVSSKKIATLTIHSPSQNPKEGEVAHAVVLNVEHRACVVCFNEFTADTSSSNEDIKKLLPVFSEKCDHWYCHGCILDAQSERARNNNGEVPEWIPCLGSCTTEDAFCPSKPKYHRMLINLLGSSIPVIAKSDAKPDAN